MNEGNRGLVLNIERFVLHDGPGIRTLVLLKGCPLRCQWCCNPEAISPQMQIMIFPARCIGCGCCMAICPLNAVTLGADRGVSIDRSLCDGCGRCASVCCSGALQSVGSLMSVEELIQCIAKDTIFWEESGGGVTIGGGEPTLQADFVSEVLRRCQAMYVHSAVESCAYAEWEQMAKIVRHADLMLVDIKHMDERTHRIITGVSNEIVLANIRRMAALTETVVRVPVIPGVNDSEPHIRQIVEFVKVTGNIRRIDLLPHHNLGNAKYGALGLECELVAPTVSSLKRGRALCELIASEGVECQVVS